MFVKFEAPTKPMIIVGANMEEILQLAFERRVWTMGFYDDVTHDHAAAIYREDLPGVDFMKDRRGRAGEGYEVVDALDEDSLVLYVNEKEDPDYRKGRRV